MQLNKNILNSLSPESGLSVPEPSIFELPEKVLQFGTGVLLRALPDYFIDKANKQGLFNGRVVVVKSTPGTADAFAKQDNLYTICVRGLEQGDVTKEDIINASISRVLHADTEWSKVLECAGNPNMQVVISNTTEVGIQFSEDKVHDLPPASFPGKLLSFLYKRFKYFEGNGHGMIIIPTELISDNGDMLKEIVARMARENALEKEFLSWLEEENVFCNSLVDRIVPGKPHPAEWQQLCSELGYTDELLTMSEVFRLWAIQGDDRVKKVLSFHETDDAVKIEPDITLFKELKLRLLNGTHTFNCGTAFLCGFDISREAITHPVYGKFTKGLMHAEIAPSIPYAIDEQTKRQFADNTFERFCNPFINHQWQSVATQYTSKMKMRNVPLLVRYVELHAAVPERMATAFAAYLLYMRSVKVENGKYYGLRNGTEYEISDNHADYFHHLWKQQMPEQVVEQVTSNVALWGVDLHQLPDFTKTVVEKLSDMLERSVMEVVTDTVNANVSIL